MIPTRWYLKRNALHGVVLVVELLDGRGYMHYVRDRQHARLCLKTLRPLVEMIALRTLLAEAKEVYDAVEASFAA